MEIKKLTMIEVGHMGGTTTKKRHGIKHFIKAGKKGGDKTKLRGSGYYAEIGKKGKASRWKNSKKNLFGPGKCRKCGIHIADELVYLQSDKDKTLCNRCG